MARRTSGPRSTAPALPPAPAQQLPPQTTTPPFAAGGLVLVTCLVATALCLLSGLPEPLAALLIVLGVFVSVAVARKQALRQRRAQLRDRLVEALAQLLATRGLDRRTVRLSDWSGPGEGVPALVIIRYSPRAKDDDPQWRTELQRIVQARLEATYRVREHKQREQVLVLEAVAPEVPEETNPIVDRAKAALTDLIGPSTKITDVETECDALKSITLRHEAGTKLAADGYRRRVENTFSRMHPGRWRALWDLEHDTVRFERRPTLPESVWVPVDEPPAVEDVLNNYRDFKIEFGVDDDGNEVSWRPAVVPQFMITGETGSGKTSTLHTLVSKVTRYGFPVWVLDAKRIEFLDFRSWPNVQIVASTLQQQVALVYRLVQVMEHRYRLIEEQGVPVESFEPLFVVLDEFTQFRSQLLKWYSSIKQKGDPSKPSSLEESGELARLARTCRIHLILATQRPDAEFLSGEMRDNFGQRLSLGRLSQSGAMMMWGNPTIGVTVPRGRVGRGVAVNEAGEYVEVQAYRFPKFDSTDPHQQELLEQLRPQTTSHPRLVILPPEQDLDLDTSEPAELRFSDYQNVEWDLAENRPEHDPLRFTRRSVDAQQGREMASPLVALGLGGRSRLGGSSTAPPARHVSAATSGETEAENVAPELPGDGYAPPEMCRPLELEVGDLIEIDESGSDTWATVDEEPLEGAEGEDLVTICWRNDADEYGTITVPTDDMLHARKLTSTQE